MKQRPISPCTSAAADADDRQLAVAVADWFEGAGRDLPWRRVGQSGTRDPWRSLVSEIMLQQTQVSRVVERFEPFMAEFPTPAAMAAAGEAAVLARWSGMGYYRRAKLLFAASEEIARAFGGEVPSTVAELRTLPGVGRYTAGAVSSLVFGRVEPIVDGNISRVLLRIHGRELAADQAADWCWERAESIACAANERVAACNEGLMELGAVVCTPKAPRCGQCPVQGRCEANRQGLQDRIPKPKKAPTRSTLIAEVVVVRDPKGRLLVERRSDQGMWAGMWQAPTRESPGGQGAGPLFEDRLPGLLRDLGLEQVTVAEGLPEEFSHATTHRDVIFRVWRATWSGRATGDRRWVDLGELQDLARSNPQRKILESTGSEAPTPPVGNTRKRRSKA